MEQLGLVVFALGMLVFLYVAARSGGGGSG